MFDSLFQGILLGLGAALPLGPINILIMNTALHSRLSAFGIGLGAMLADLSYLALILLGLHLFLDSPLWQQGLRFLGGGFLLYLAWRLFQARHQSVKERGIRVKPFAPSLLQGYTLTLANPYTIAFWLSIAPLIASGSSQGIWLMIGLLMAILGWIWLLPTLIHRSRHLISDRIAMFFSLFSSLVMLYFALLLWVGALI